MFRTRNNASAGGDILMRVDIARLKGAIVTKGMTQGEFSEVMDIDQATFSRKLKALGIGFTIGEMHKIVDILELSADEAKNIFLVENSQ